VRTVPIGCVHNLSIRGRSMQSEFLQLDQTIETKWSQLYIFKYSNMGVACCDLNRWIDWFIMAWFIWCYCCGGYSIDSKGIPVDDVLDININYKLLYGEKPSKSWEKTVMIIVLVVLCSIGNRGLILDLFFTRIFDPRVATSTCWLTFLQQNSFLRLTYHWLIIMFNCNVIDNS